VSHLGPVRNNCELSESEKVDLGEEDPVDYAILGCAVLDYAVLDFAVFDFADFGDRGLDHPGFG
jgi:hypothetical protein